MKPAYILQLKCRCLLMLVGLCIALTTSAITKTWAGKGSLIKATTSTDLAVGANWQPAGVPRATDSCVILLTSSVALTQSAALTFGSLTVQVTSGFLNTVTVTVTVSHGITIQKYYTYTGNSKLFGGTTIINFNVSGGDFSCATFIQDQSSALFGTLTSTYTISSGRSFTVTGDFTLIEDVLNLGSGSSTTIVNSGTLTIGGRSSVDPTEANITSCTIENDGTINFNGSTTLGLAAGGAVYLQSKTAGTPVNSKVYFRSDADFNPNCFTVASNTIANYYFDAPLNGSQTLTLSSPDIQFSNVTIGTGLNSPKLTLAGTRDMTITGDVLINTGAVLSGTSSNNILVGGNWTNSNTSGNGYAANNTVTFDGSGTQTLSGLTTFYDLTLMQSTGAITDFGSTTTTVANNLTAESGTMKGNTSTIIFTGAAGAMKGASDKYFYNVQINSGANIAHSTGSDKMHIDNRYTNNGIFTQRSSYTTYFDKPGGTPSLNGTGTTTFGNLIIGKSGGAGSGTALTANAHNFTVGGTGFTFNHSNSTFDGGTGTVTFSGSVNCLLSNATGVTGTSASFFGANIQNRTTLEATANIKAGTFASHGTLVVSGTLNANGFLTIKSDANGDAVIGNSAGTIRGNVTIERNIPWRRAWRFLSVPLSSAASNTQTIRSAWMEGSTPNPNVNTHNNPNPGYGTEITYLHGDNANGYDENTSESPSIKVWDAGSNSWIPINSTNIPINTYPAYCLFVRGSRAVDLSQGQNAPQHDATILRMTGLINQGAASQSFSVPTAGNFALIKNPYASPVKLTGGGGVAYSGATPNYFYVWDPKIGGTYGVGKYVTCNGAAWSILGGTYSASTPVGVVQSGQAFLVQSTATTGSIGFTENAKTNSEFNTNGKALNPPAVIYTQLVLATDSLKITDGVCAVFGSRYSKGEDAFDAPKIWNFEGDNMGLIRDTNALSIESRPIPVMTDTLFFRLYLYSEPYALRIFSQNLPGRLPAKAWLVDKYLDTETEINLYDTTLYNFVPVLITDENGNQILDTNSYRNRFMLVFNRQMNAKPIAVTKAINQDDPGVSGIANSTAVKATGMNIYPNPVTGNKAMLGFINMDKGIYEATVYNSKGEKMASNILEHAGGDNEYPLPLNSSWSSGIYHITILDQNSKKMINLKLIINK